MKTTTAQALNAFIEEWEETPERNKELFLHFKNYLESKENILLDFIARPGVTYSLRAAHSAQKEKELFVMVDVIEDNPRWLSICFYNDMIGDPVSKGDVVPGGLLGEDAVCFDLEKWDEELIGSIEGHLDEASINAARG
jgi:hypothetical protein